jgi:hypothetical protein
VCWQRKKRSKQSITGFSTITVNQFKHTSSSSITEQALWAWLTGLDQHGQRPWPVKEAEGGEEEVETHQSPRCIPGWHGGAVPARPREDFTVAPPGALQTALPPVCPQTHRSPRRSTAGVRGDAGEVSRSVANLMQNPEWDPAMDLLREEAADETVRWRWKRTLGRVFFPRSRRWWSPELAGGARRRRWRSSRQRDQGEERGRGRSGSVWPTQVLAGWVRPSRGGWAGPMGQSPSANSIQFGWIWNSISLYKINSNLRSNQIYLS